MPSDLRKCIFFYFITNYLQLRQLLSRYESHQHKHIYWACHSLSCCQLWCCFCTSLFWRGEAQSCTRTCGSWELTSFFPGIYQKHGHTHSHSCIPLSEDCCFAWGCEKLETTKGLCTQLVLLPIWQPPFPFPSFRSLTLQIYFISLCQVLSWYKNMV